MRRLLFAFLTVLSVITFCSCSDLSGTRNVSGSGLDFQVQNSEYDSSDTNSEIDISTPQYMLEKEANLKAWKLTDKSEWQTFTKNCDGVVLTVTTDKSEYRQDEPIKIKAAIQNKTDRDICLFYYNSRKSYPVEIYAELSLNGTHLSNERANYGLCALDDVLVPAGEECVDYLNLNTIFNDKILPEKGVYEGSCWINVCSESNYTYGDVTRYSVNFSVTLI